MRYSTSANHLKIPDLMRWSQIWYQRSYVLSVSVSYIGPGKWESCHWLGLGSGFCQVLPFPPPFTTGVPKHGRNGYKNWNSVSVTALAGLQIWNMKYEIRLTVEHTSLCSSVLPGLGGSFSRTGRSASFIGTSPALLTSKWGRKLKEETKHELQTVVPGAQQLWWVLRDNQFKYCHQVTIPY